MKVQRIIYCEAPDCEVHAQTAEPPPYLPGGFVHVGWWDGSYGQPHEYAFCSLDCVMKWAATFPPSELIRYDPDASQFHLPEDEEGE